ncbi:hypothetical protein ACFP2T_16515 [Plantactinospora solaniradicis]|uniref:Uncharacterized protein n=1 Tax=Plantactinospora solaniradicis TaxID=1723736 RepID=A0ABW1K993_9ACTN
MPFTGLQKVAADPLNRIQPVPYYAEQSSPLAVLTTLSAVPGLSITLSTVTAGATYHAIGFLDWDNLDANTSSGLGILNIDGASQTKQIRYAGTAATDKATMGQQWFGTLASAGSHTFTMQAQADAASDLTVFSHSTLVVVIYEVV